MTATAPTVLPDEFGKSTPMANEKAPYKTFKTMDFLKDKAELKALEAGTAFYGFNCSSGAGLGAREKELIQRTVNLTTFTNGDPHYVREIDMAKKSDLESFTFMCNKAMYVLPAVGLDSISPEILATVASQKACQPGACKVWEDCTRPDTFRLTKTIIRAVYKVTIQFKCSWVPKEHLAALATLSDGLEVHQAILLERTKRDVSHQDSTFKVRSVLLYHKLNGGGMIVTNFTCVANTSVPSVVASIVDKLGWAGASEVAETAVKTREYLRNRVSPAKDRK